MCPKCGGTMIEKTGVLFWIFMGVAWMAASFIMHINIFYIGHILMGAGIIFILFSPLLARFYKCKKCNKLFCEYPKP